MGFKNEYLSLLYLLLILLPIAFIMFKGGNKRKIFRHAITWTIVILLLFLFGKMMESFRASETGEKPPPITSE